MGGILQKQRIGHKRNFWCPTFGARHQTGTQSGGPGVLAIAVEIARGLSPGERWLFDGIRITAAPKLVPGTNGTVRLGSERKFSSGTWKIFVILPRALAIDDDFKNLPWLKSRTFLASAN